MMTISGPQNDVFSDRELGDLNDMEKEFSDPIGVARPPNPSTAAALEKYTTCGNCRASYMITPDMLGDSGRRVKCSVCENVWFQSADRLLELRSGYSVQKFDVDAYAGGKKQQGAGSGGPANGALRHTRTGAVTLFVGNMPFSVNEDKLR